MKKADLTDEALTAAVAEMSSGLVDAELGGHVVKKRVARPGQGKQGGARTIVATRMADRWIFLYGFARNERDNSSKVELKALQELATELLGFNDRQLASALSKGEMMEVCDGNEQT